MKPRKIQLEAVASHAEKISVPVRLEGKRLRDVLVLAGLAQSGNEASRLIKAGAISILVLPPKEELTAEPAKA